MWKWGSLPDKSTDPRPQAEGPSNNCPLRLRSRGDSRFFLSIRFLSREKVHSSYIRRWHLLHIQYWRAYSFKSEKRELLRYCTVYSSIKLIPNNQLTTDDVDSRIISVKTLLCSHICLCLSTFSFYYLIFCMYVTHLILCLVLELIWSWW